MAASAAQDKLAEVVQAGTAIARGLDLDETLQAVVEAAARVTRAAYCALAVVGPDRRISRFITTGLRDEERERIGNPPTHPCAPSSACRSKGVTPFTATST
jgi:GAF domain-containing protein